ncbi:MAG: hypothetical protein HC934_01230 [Acaryochloridaceae cyanobacterium SU_2_1]|nr:hypothetical protein [Acaryochloridaceae cyanobacterium SU_2_1]
MAKPSSQTAPPPPQNSTSAVSPEPKLPASQPSVPAIPSPAAESTSL